MLKHFHGILSIWFELHQSPIPQLTKNRKKNVVELLRGERESEREALQHGSHTGGRLINHDQPWFRRMRGRWEAARVSPSN